MKYFRRILLISLISVIAVSFFILTACSKEDETPEPDYSIIHKLKKVTKEGESFPHIHYFVTNNYEYDSAGRLERFIHTTPGGNDTTVYSYNDSILVSVKRGAYMGPDTSIFILNKKGLAVTEVKLSVNEISRYTYDEDGHCILITYFSYGADTSDITSPGATRSLEYRNGNLIKETTSHGYSKEFSYYEKKVNTLGNYNKGMFFLGKSSKNLEIVKKTTDIFDWKNRLKTRTYTESDGTEEYLYY